MIKCIVNKQQIKGGVKMKKCISILAGCLLVMQTMLALPLFQLKVDAAGTGQQVFYDDFSSRNYASGGWIVSGNCNIAGSTNPYSLIYKGGIMEKTLDMSNYENITLSFKCFMETDSDSLDVEWYNGSTWTLLESIPTGTYDSKSYSLNVSGISNFRIRFKSVFDDDYDLVKIDDVDISAQDLPTKLFSDDFESKSFVSGQWVNGNSAVSPANPYEGMVSASLNKGDSLKKAISTVGYKNIKIKYVRMSKDCESNDRFTSEWFDGKIWHEIESYQGNSPWTLKEYILPSGAEENPYFQIRFKTLNGRTFIDNVEITADKSNKTQNGVLIIVSNPLYKTGNVAQAIDTYKSDIDKEYGWNNKIIKVNNVADPTADLDYATPETLKALIRTYYDQGYKGFVFIGSEPAIPVPFIRIENPEIPEKYDDNPCDLFYADMDHSWGSVTAGGYYQIDNNNIDKYAPEMFYGRISPGYLANNLTDEANMVVEYLNKVHNYKLNGSNLTREQQKRSFVFYDSNLKTNHGVIGSLLSLGTEIHGYFDDTKTTPEKLSELLEEGYQFGALKIHSTNQAHYIDVLQNNIFVPDLFTVDRLKTINPKIHCLSLCCCTACKFSTLTDGKTDEGKTVNLGTTYLFYKNPGQQNYVLNVSGSVGVWGFEPNKDYWDSIADGLSVGEAYKNFLNYLSSNRNPANNYKPDRSVPKAVLLGDPTLRYKVPLVSNKAPYPFGNLAGWASDIRHKARIGETFTIAPLDEDGGNIFMDVQVLPATVDYKVTNGVLSWTPSASDFGKIYDFKITVYNKDESGEVINKYVEEFSVECQ